MLGFNVLIDKGSTVSLCLPVRSGNPQAELPFSQALPPYPAHIHLRLNLVPKGLCLLGKRSTAELHFQSQNTFKVQGNNQVWWHMPTTANTGL